MCYGIVETALALTISGLQGAAAYQTQRNREEALRIEQGNRDARIRATRSAGEFAREREKLSTAFDKAAAKARSDDPTGQLSAQLRNLVAREKLNLSALQETEDLRVWQIEQEKALAAFEVKTQRQASIAGQAISTIGVIGSALGAANPAPTGSGGSFGGTSGFNSGTQVGSGFNGSTGQSFGQVDRTGYNVPIKRGTYIWDDFYTQ